MIESLDVLNISGLRVRVAGAGMVCKKCLVGGRVQGVFYRATTAQRAAELAIRGYARNLPDGRVEVLACGDDAAVEAFVSWLWIGSPASEGGGVEGVGVAPASVLGPTGFPPACRTRARPTGRCARDS